MYFIKMINSTDFCIFDDSLNSEYRRVIKEKDKHYMLSIKIIPSNEGYIAYSKRELKEFIRKGCYVVKHSIRDKVLDMYLSKEF